MSSSKFPKQVAELKTLFPSLDIDIVEYYLTINNGNYEKTVQQIMDEQEQEEKKKPSSSRGQPSSSRGQPSSSRGQPSSSGDYMDGPIDLEDPRFRENVEKKVKEVNFDTWLDTMIHANSSQKAKNLRSKLIHLFGKKNWSVIDPRGDGFCGLYAATIDYSSENAVVMSRDTIIDSIVLGLEEYYKARELHKTNKIPLPNELRSADFYMEFTPEDSMMISQENVKNETNKRAFRKRLQVLETLTTIPGEAFVLLAYAYKRNFLVLNYDDKFPLYPYILVWTPCYADVFILEGNVIYPHEAATSIMFNNGHYFLFHNTNTQLKKETIARIIQGEWQPMIEARGVRKSKKSRKARFTTKMKKQKLKKPKYSIKKIKQPKKRTKKY